MSVNDKTILIVDDDTSTCELLADMIQTLGYTTFSANDGIEAMTIFEEKKPDLVISDIQMPKMDGMELLRKLKRINPQTKIIILTGYPSADTIIETIENEGFTYLVKPVKISSLEAVILRAFD